MSGAVAIGASSTGLFGKASAASVEQHQDLGRGDLALVVTCCTNWCIEAWTLQTGHGLHLVISEGISINIGFLRRSSVRDDRCGGCGDFVSMMVLSTPSATMADDGRLSCARSYIRCLTRWMLVMAIISGH